MQSDPQAAEALRARYRIRGRRARDHQARRGQDAGGKGNLDGFIDLACQAQVVGRNGDPPQSAVSRRSRRKRKNSTPSRSRRFAIVGDRTISPTMAAIFGARK